MFVKSPAVGHVTCRRRGLTDYHGGARQSSPGLNGSLFSVCGYSGASVQHTHTHTHTDFDPFSFRSRCGRINDVSAYLTDFNQSQVIQVPPARLPLFVQVVLKKPSLTDSS